MAKKRNLKREKAERNREYARQFQKSCARNGPCFRSTLLDNNAITTLVMPAAPTEEP